VSKRQKLALILNTLAIALVLLFTFLAVKDFLVYTNNNVEEQTSYNMELITANRVDRVTTTVAALEGDALLAADLISQNGGIDTAKEDYFRLLFKGCAFEEIGVASTDGGVLSVFGSSQDVSTEEWFESALNGRRGVYVNDGEARLTVYAPVYKGSLIEGVFFGRYNAAGFTAGRIGKLEGQDVLFYLVRSGGAFLYAPSGQKLFDISEISAQRGFFAALESAAYPGGGSAVSVEDALIEGVDGHFRIKTQTQDAYAYYMPVGLDDWYALITVDYVALSDRNAELGRMAVELLAKVLFALLVATLIVMFYSWASKQAAVKSADRMNAMANSIPCGVQQFEPLGNMAFRYVSDGFFQMSGYSEDELKKVFSNSFLSIIHPDDRDQVEALIRGNRDTETPLELKYRIITKDGRIVWILNRATLCEDGEGSTYYQCVCVDITRLKQVEQNLVSKAQIDQLTGLFNREAARMLIREFFLDASSRYGSHAFFMLDMDGFKKHNDTYGHVEGDRLLCRIAGILRSTFRGTDIICRLAGDEFVVFMKSAESREVISDKAHSVLKSVSELKNSEDMHSSSVSISIGISLTPQDGGTFEELYKKADEALYAAKRSGRNRVVFSDAMPVFSEQSLFDDKSLFDDID
jgi:diguanylate cyclase (GGDEF)-like protein/PAS domain S-box-containing protein